MKNLNTIVKYHGCGIGYLDGTRELVKKSCSKPTFNPFWKNPEHTSNRVAKSTRHNSNWNLLLIDIISENM